MAKCVNTIVYETGMAKRVNTIVYETGMAKRVNHKLLQLATMPSIMDKRSHPTAICKRLSNKI